MSIEAVHWALDVPVGGNAKVILIGIANHARPDGTGSYPSLDTLAEYAHCDRATVWRNLRKLEGDGWIERIGKGPQGQTSWRLMFGRKDAQNAHAGRGQNAIGNLQPVAVGVASGVAPVQPEPLTVKVGDESPTPPPVESEAVRLDDLVFTTWLASTGKSERTVFDAKRRRVVTNALRDFPLDDLLDAVDGWRFSAHHRGENRTGTVYNELTLLLRDATQIEKFRDLKRRGVMENVVRLDSRRESAGELIQAMRGEAS